MPLYDITQTGQQMRIIFTDAASATDYLAVFGTQYGYQATVTNPAFDPTKPEEPGNQRTIPNPVTRAEFFIDKLTDWMDETYKAGSLNAAADAARAAERDRIKDKLRKQAQALGGGQN